VSGVKDMIDSAESRIGIKLWQDNGRAAARKHFKNKGVHFKNVLPHFMPQERRCYTEGWNSEMRLLWAQSSSSENLVELFGEG
jgi:hypothetical protein